MSELLRNTNPEIALALTGFLCLGAAAWSLRMSCSLCSVQPPDFWQAALTSVIVVVANIVMRFWLNVTGVQPGLETQLVAPLVITAAIIAMSVRIGPLSAVAVTVVQAVVCGFLYLGVSMLGSMASSAMPG